MHSWYLLLFACLEPSPDSDLPDVALTTPQIAKCDLVCDTDAATWTLKVHASSWTGGGRLLLSRGDGYYESHPVKATRSAADGGSEDLRLDLDVASDWREQSPGSSTVFGCTPSTSWRFLLFDLEGSTVDCREEGPDVFPAGAPLCP
jgi:hypothetical protein